MTEIRHNTGSLPLFTKLISPSKCQRAGILQDAGAVMRALSSARQLVAIFFLLICQTGFGQNLKVLVNHIGYEKDGPKSAVILGHDGDKVNEFKVIDCLTGRNVLSGSAVKVGPVDQWKDWCFWTADFSPINTEGTYLLECATSRGKV